MSLPRGEMNTGAVFDRALEQARVAAAAEHAVILVEGLSDQAAVMAVASKRGRSLTQEGISVLALGGVTNFSRFVGMLGPQGHNLRLAGIYDEAEMVEVIEALSRGGYGHDLDRAGLETHGFYAAVRDLEDELIRTLGPEGVEAVIVSLGEARKWQSFQNQPAQRGRPVLDQLRRFMGTKSGRKIRYGSALVEALDHENVPGPLDAVLARF